MNTIKMRKGPHLLELFFDLIFVVSLGIIGHEFLHPTITGVFISLILFLTIYQIWKNITEFNVYFFSKSFYIRILFLFVMLPVLFIVAINDYSVKNNTYLIIVSFTFSRFILAFIWRKLIYKNKNIVNKYINKLALTIVSLVFLITASFIYELFLVQPNILDIASGFEAKFTDGQSLLLGIGIIGTTVMPHNLYLHSSLVKKEFPELESKVRVKKLIKDVAFVLSMTLIVNAAILILLTGTFLEMECIM